MADFGPSGSTDEKRRHEPKDGRHDSNTTRASNPDSHNTVVSALTEEGPKSPGSRAYTSDR